jgi:lipopolysaccharide export system permease protein
MSILLRYYVKEFFKYFFLILLGMTALLLVAEFFDKMDEFYAKKSPVHIVFQYLLHRAPKPLLLVTPIASLLSILFTVGIASKWRETVAIRAAGGSLKKLFSFFLLMGLMISVLVLLIGETLAPLATRKAASIRNTKILNKSPKIIYKEGALWVKGFDGSLVRIENFVEDRNKILRISIFSFTPDFALGRRIEAQEAEWIDGRWELKNATVFSFKENTTAKHEKLVFTALEEPKIFKDEMRKPDEMNFYELYSYYKRLENAGFKNLKYIVELYGKLAYPTVNFIMIIFGVALALNTKLGGGLRAAGLGLIVIIGYWLILSICLALGNTGLIYPEGNTGLIYPELAPWISPALFGISGWYMFRRIKE